MKEAADYITLMPVSSEVGTPPTRFWRHSGGDKPKLLDDGQLSFLFVLHGELACTFSGRAKTKLTAPQMMVVDKEQLRALACVGDTVILECVMSDRMTPFMQSTSRAFSMPCSEIIPLNTKIQQWCSDMLTDLIENPNRNNNYHHARCSALTALLLEYPRNILGTLYIPLYACSQHCETCSRIFVRNNIASE